ncbi:MAG: hypothetical protein J7449_12760, partial [Thermomicrobium sp.]|nr:hypothetical protein [Thermomicrobium sp.]
MRQRFRILLVLVVAAALVLGACSGSLLGKPKSTPTPTPIKDGSSTGIYVRSDSVWSYDTRAAAPTPTPKPSPVGTIVVGGNPTCIPGDECWPTPTPTPTVIKKPTIALPTIVLPTPTPTVVKKPTIVANVT